MRHFPQIYGNQIEDDITELIINEYIMKVDSYLGEIGTSLYRKIYVKKKNGIYFWSIKTD